MEKMLTLQNLMDEVRGMEVEVKVEKTNKPMEAKKSENFTEYFKQASKEEILLEAELPNQILAFQIYDKYANAKVKNINSKKLYNDMLQIGKVEIDRSDIDTRVSVVSKNAKSIACALDGYNPDIIDSMIRMEVVGEAMERNTEENETENNNVDLIFSTLFETALKADYKHKVLEVKEDDK